MDKMYVPVLLLGLLVACGRAQSGCATEMSSFAFSDSLGINTHIYARSSSYGDLNSTIGALQFLGVRHVRDTASEKKATIDSYISVARAGIRFDLIQRENTNIDFAMFEPMSVYLDFIEGPNEVNAEMPKAKNAAALLRAAQFQRFLFESVRKDSKLKNIPIIIFSTQLRTAFDLPPYGDSGKFADFSNVHAYSIPPQPPHAYLSHNISLLSCSVPGHPIIVTECGNFTLPSDRRRGGVNEAVQAKWTLVAWADDIFVNHAAKHYIYELSDEKSDPTNDREQLHYGLFHVDWTPKPSAIAVHNMNAILNATDQTQSVARPEVPKISVVGLPRTGHYAVLTTPERSFFLVIWQEPQLWNAGRRDEVFPPISNISIDLGPASSTVGLFDPVISGAAIKQMNGIQKMKLSLADDLLLLKVTPN